MSRLPVNAFSARSWSHSLSSRRGIRTILRQANDRQLAGRQHLEHLRTPDAES